MRFSAKLTIFSINSSRPKQALGTGEVIHQGSRCRYKILDSLAVEFANLTRAWATLGMCLMVDMVGA